MSAHTPEPWAAECVLRPDLDDDPMGEYRVEPAATQLTTRYFAADPETETEELDAVHEENRANFKRIVGCVNGCKGIQDPETTVPAMLRVLDDLSVWLIAADLSTDTLRKFEKDINAVLNKTK